MKYTKEELDLIDQINQYVSHREITDYKALPKEVYQAIKTTKNATNAAGSLQSYLEFLGYSFKPLSKYPKTNEEILTKLKHYYPDHNVRDLENVDRNLYYAIQKKALDAKIDIPEYLNELGFHFVFKSNNYSHAPSFYIGKSEEEYIERLNTLFPEKIIVVEEFIEKDRLLFEHINYLRQIRSIQTIEELLEFFGFAVDRRFQLGMQNSTRTYRTNIIGAGEAGVATSVDMKKDTVHQTNSLFWDTKGHELLGATSLPLYGAFVSEDNCQLFGDVAGKKLLEIGCGSGESLRYHGERKAGELWGIDLSEKQIEKTQKHLAASGLSAHLICSPMEEECGIPEDYFDFVYSIYAIGWTTDLEGTFKRIASYLKKDGVFIFSWSHPIHKCVVAEEDLLVFKKSYFDESWYSVVLGESTLTLSDRKLSTYVNELARAGFVIEQMIEQSDPDLLQAGNANRDFAKKAERLPVTFVFKARKL